MSNSYLKEQQDKAELQLELLNEGYQKKVLVLTTQLEQSNFSQKEAVIDQLYAVKVAYSELCKTLRSTIDYYIREQEGYNERFAKASTEPTTDDV